MVRLRTWGFEWNVASAFTTAALIESVQAGAIAATIDSGVFRSGAFSAKFATAGVSNGTSMITDLRAAEVALATTYYGRIYLRFDNLPAGTVKVVQWYTAVTGALVAARITSAGKVQLWNSVAASQIGSDSDETITANDGKWHCFELSCLTDTGSVDTTELRLNGTSVASATGLALTDSAIGRFGYGWIDAPGTSKVMYADDGAINDSTGAVQNVWPGQGKVVLLVPISDSARATLWTTNAGTTTTNFEAVNNIPPVGIAANTTPDNAYEKHAGGATGTTDAYDANMTTYTTAGLVSTDAISLVQGVVSAGEEIATGTKNLSFEVLSNPVVGSTGSFDVTLGTSGLQATWPDKWWSKWGPAVSGPVVTLGTSPVMRVIRPETALRVASVAAMGLYVEYQPAPIPVTRTPQLGPILAQ